MSDPRLKDKNWRINNLYKIKDQNKRKIKFVCNRAQEHFRQHAHTRNLILKSRQLGFTTFETIDMIDDTLFNRNYDCMMLSYDQESQTEIFDNKVKFAWDNYSENLSKLYSVDTQRANKLKFGFGDGSFSSISVRTKGRSGTFNRLHVSEFARICKQFPAKADEVITGTVPAIPLDGRVDFESTAEGDYGEFYEMFWKAWERGDPEHPLDYKAHFYNWTWDDAEMKKVVLTKDLPPEFKEYQREHKLTDLQISYYYTKWVSLNENWKRLRQEYPTTPEEAFISSGDKFFDEEFINILAIRKGKKVGSWFYYADYVPGHRYGAGCDVAEGVGRNNSTIAIWDFDAQPKPEIVAVYASDRIAPDRFAHEIKNGCTRYGNCIVGVERNNHGHATLAILKGIYYNIYGEKQKDRISDKETGKLGWHSNIVTKPKMMYDIRTALEEKLINIPCAFTVREFKSYPNEDLNDYGQAKQPDEHKKHWDRVIAASIGFQMRSEATAGDPRNLTPIQQELKQNKLNQVARQKNVI